MIKNKYYYMERALELAELADGYTMPNPMVGAVIVKDGEIVGEGYHQKAGTPHAERHALVMAGEKAHGATMYVSLEPCCHHGKTPPCTDAIIEAGIKEVYVASLDPNAKVNGKGVDKLREAGIMVHYGLLDEEAGRLNEVFMLNHTKHRPYIALKAAQSIDGRIALSSGESQWITNEHSRKYGHYLRRRYGAILVGINTIMNDDPTLDIRYDIDHLDRMPVRIVLDTNLRINENAKVLDTSSTDTIIYCSKKVADGKIARLKSKGVQIVQIDFDGEYVDLHKVITDLYSKGITGILVEGGSEVTASFIRENLADKIYLFVAPKILGGNSISSFNGINIDELKNCYELNFNDVKKIGSDILIEGYFNHKG